MTSLLEAQGLRIEGRLQPTDLRVSAGEFIAVIGPNGGGKTSLLRCIADVDGHADAIQICGEALKQAAPARRSHLLTFLPAARETVWPISVRDVVALGLTAPDPARIAEMLDLLRLTHLAERPVSSLSTGERSRALLARALAPNPRLLLLDEPLSNLDPFWALRLVEILRSTVDSTSAALIALHDLNQLESFDRVLLIDNGRLLLDGTPEQMVESDMLRDSFGVERLSGRWRIRPRADQRSSL